MKSSSSEQVLNHHRVRSKSRDRSVGLADSLWEDGDSKEFKEGTCPKGASRAMIGAA
ncbi:unnamed protein product [Dovyalis caffra]|uniref:Uncharacterized protein n=1 Tax=Dovyalis caffra TaxID=77055 RepID=A0AAV1SI22_9ROSI|nr:unnamed protein product [Dovyalis caffra]